MSRDYATEMRAVIDAEAQGTYAAPVVAAHIVEKLRATDADLLRGWLDLQAENFIRHAINLRDCSTRTHNRTAVRRSVFREAAENFEAGNAEPLVTGFLDEVYVVEDGNKVPLREMRSADLLFAADDYKARAAQHLMQEAFLRALAKKVRSKKVGDVLDEEKVASLWRSLS